uniref:uncharacterized protein LOC100186505 isoform X1 n=1 Tax=Ciona intestinalis TaxID=7719 RepID=UPI000180B676|nr:uncharacterized protein LOC100186505 isoform X1 [Ciona intestinalis]|eukprot:XP_002123510.1 uncharacterized protein LOC100186505 isoform X1 [Ciona intestinalis]
MVQESELAEKEKAEEKRSRKISIILPDDENKKKSHLKDDVTLRNKESVTSYSIVNASSRRRSSGISVQTSSYGRRKLSTKSLGVAKERSEIESDCFARKGSSGTSPTLPGSPRSSTWSARERMGSTVLTKIPIVSYRRLEVAGKKQMLSYTDINIIRRQMRSQKEEIQRQRFRRDYKRTTSDIYRMQLDRTENLTEENELCFKAACVTYLGTSPGARRAVAAQLD